MIFFLKTIFIIVCTRIIIKSVKNLKNKNYFLSLYNLIYTIVLLTLGIFSLQ